MLEVALRVVRSWLGIREASLDRAGSSVRRLWIFIDLARTNLAGMLADGVFTQGLDPLDDKDYRSWLAEHGARPATIDSALIRGLYDFVFAEVAGRQNLGAGAAIRLSLRTGFAYQGAIMYKMHAGMGDVVFAPLYEYLSRRGVKFQFFHRVRKLGLSADKRNVESIELGIQATPTTGNYDPLVLVRGLPCWPNCPRYEQLAEGDELKSGNIDLESCWSGWPDVASSTLRRGSGFDRVILGIALGGLPAICADLVSFIPRWRELFGKLPTIATGAAQLWWNASLPDLGWRLPSPVLTGYEPPFDTWADMSQTIAAEDWAAVQRPLNVAYLCGVLPDPDILPPCESASDFPMVEHAAIRELLLRWLREKGPKLWPGLVDPGTGDLRWDWLHAASGSNGEARLDDQFWRGNFDPSGRYVQSPAGSLRYRLRPSESGVDNLFLAGDWTRNGINVGCVEAAVISGMRAARDLLGNSAPLPGESDESTIEI
ncbi:MAG: FAD-dependent oxidoreductase [Planctomycetota bacterium]